MLQEAFNQFFAIVAGVGAFGFVCWNGYWFVRLGKVNKKIRKTEDDYDAVEPSAIARTRGHLVTQGQLEKLIEVERKPIIRKLERLEQERGFVKDKLLFAKK